MKTAHAGESWDLWSPVVFHYGTETIKPISEHSGVRCLLDFPS